MTPERPRRKRVRHYHDPDDPHELMSCLAREMIDPSSALLGKPAVAPGDRFHSLYGAAQRHVARARQAQAQQLVDQVGYGGTVRYVHGPGSSTFDHATGQIIIRQHAFYEPGGVKSVFLHEVAHSRMPIWATEYMVDMEAARIAEQVFGHSDDIVLPFCD